jgi:hypothetical protein
MRRYNPSRFFGIAAVAGAQRCSATVAQAKVATAAQGGGGGGVEGVRTRRKGARSRLEGLGVHSTAFGGHRIHSRVCWISATQPGHDPCLGSPLVNLAWGQTFGLGRSRALGWGNRPIPLGMGIMLRNHPEIMPLLFRLFHLLFFFLTPTPPKIAPFPIR